ncbi:uncharacterized protein [Medicago truncatula]|uniref:uncharacterized protein n=1 Tax=Medicago truncatula TaxID=3880 RepID=UPI001967D641|nr:uncharacterized protein LOC120577569 [Medicago truncatula]
MNWLKEGDANSKYFHGCMSSRHRNNAINMVAVDGVSVEGAHNIRAAVYQHFSTHFKSVRENRPRLDGSQFRKLSNLEAALIPKVSSPQQLTDYQPISLVGCLYKVLAKVLANRLCIVIGSVVSANQSAFVKGKQILDGILIANEVVDEARRAKRELLLFKVDFEKAYDSVDLKYLDMVMDHMNFPTLWRKWIKECVGTAKASVLVNGSPTDEFIIERGLHQGDPLSPFLFLLAAEGFNVLMQAMEGAHIFNGYGVGQANQVRLTHLQFAYDTLLIGEKSWLNVRSMRAVLLLFEEVSGLKVNFHKSMLTGVNVTDSWLSEAAMVMNCRKGSIPFIYLGLPIGGDSWKLSFWKPVLDRIAARLSSWNNKFLSFGGRLARYGEDGGRLKEGGSQSSLWWRMINKVREGIGEGVSRWFDDNVRRVIRDGRSTLFWHDTWLGDIPLKLKFPRLFDLAETKERMVEEMWRLGWEEEGGAWVWRRRLLAWEEESVRECCALLLNIVLQDNVCDTWRWLLDPVNGYSVRESYRYLTLSGVNTDRNMVDDVWHKHIPSKVSLMVWRLFRNRLPTRDNLIRRGTLHLDASTCVTGCGASETALHLFLLCDLSSTLWLEVRLWLGIYAVSPADLRQHFQQF